MNEPTNAPGHVPWDLATLAERGTDIIARFDRERRHVYVNPAVEAATGRSRDEFIGKTNEELGLPEDFCALWRQALVTAFAASEESEVHFVFEGPQGPRHFHGRVAPERDEAGNVVSVLAISRDVTESRTNRLLEAAVLHLPAGVALVEAPTGKPLLKNDEAARIFGVEPAPTRIKSVADYKAYVGFHPDGTPYRAEDWPLARSIRTGEVVEAEEAEIVRADGSRAYIRMSSTPVRDSHGGIVAGLVTFHDVTRTKQLERDMQFLYRLSDVANRSAALEPVLDAALDAILELLHVDRASVLLFDDDGVMRFRGWRGLSEAYRNAVEGHSPWTRTERNATPIFVADVEADPEMQAYLDALRREGIRALGFVPLVYGEQLVGKFMLYRNAPGTFSSRQVELAAAVAAQVASAVGRALAERAIREASRRKDEFLAMLSHELRNPLAATRSALALLSESGPDADHNRRYMDVIGRQTTHLIRIVDDLLDVSRVTRGLIELRLDTLDAGALVHRAVEAVRSAIEQKRHDVSVTLPLKPAMVRADAVRLEQVLVNLVMNAVKYTDPGGRIRIELETTDDCATFRIADNGIGIEPAMADRVFDLFQQVPKGVDRAQGGLGIGLTIVKKLVDLHGGTIQVRSEGLARGSEFSFTVPLARAHPAEPTVERHPHAVSSSARRVLVVDDHQDSGEMLVALLENWGHVVWLAADGAAAVRMARELRPDCVLLDIGLPTLDGYEVARLLREDPATAHAILVAVTGFGQESDRERSAEVGFNHHLVKPVDPNALRALLALPSTTALSNEPSA